MHNNSDHCEYKKTYWWVTDHYWWKRLYKDVQRHVNICKKYQHRVFFKKEEKLHSIYMSIIWKKVEVDVVHLPCSKRCQYLIMTWDDLSEWLEWCVLSNVTVKAVIKFLYQNIFCHHNCLQKFVINEGFKNKKEVEKLLK